MAEDDGRAIESLQAEVALLKKECQKLHKMNIIYERALSACNDGFLIVGRDGNIIEINKAYCDYFGVKRSETIGKHIYSLISNSKMIKIMDENLVELDAIHTFPDGLTASGEKHVAVTRMPVIENGETIASVAIVKFSKYTFNLASQLHKLEEEIAYYRKHLNRNAITSFEDLPSRSPRYAEVRRLAERFAGNDLPILLLGETGVGKEVFANAIHHASHRAGQPFVCVNSASVPGELLESELFGYMDGAFTGSRRTGKKGKFEIADGGTLFLDEIGDMPLQMQTKLLRVLQNGEIEKLGAEKPVRVDVRIIAATNQDLSASVKEKKFRPDMYYRLNVLPITIPPLRERAEDIPELAAIFLAELKDNYGRQVQISDRAWKMLQTYSWPGNVRELRNAIGRGFMMTEDNEILPEHLPASVQESADILSGENDDATIHDTRMQAERDLILNCLKKYEGNFCRAAQALGIHRATLYSRVHGMGIAIEEFRATAHHRNRRPHD